MPPRKKRPVRRRGFIVVRGPRVATPRDAATGQWKSVPEDILWATYTSSPERWPALKGLTRQVPVLRYRMDFGIAARKVGVEVDGLAYHSGQVQWQKDHERQRRIEAAGWRIVRFTAKEASDNPRGVLDEINQMWSRGTWR